MPRRYGGARRGYRRSRRTVRRTVRGRPKATKNRSAIYQLSRKVNKVARTVNQRNQTVTYTTQETGSAISANFTEFDLTPLNDWTSVFSPASSNIAFDQRYAAIQRFRLRYHLTNASEINPIDCTVMLLAAKSKKVFEDTTQMTTLSQGTDYVSLSGNLVMINQKRFKVFYQKTHRIATGPQAGNNNLVITTATNPRDLNGYKTMRPNWPIRNTMGNWDDVATTSLPYYMHLRLVVFNNNSSLDLQWPTIEYNVLWDVKVHN